MKHLAGLVLVLWASGAKARPEPVLVGEARARYEVGRAFYDAGNYTEAVRAFTEGYQLVPRPEFLINLGQAYRHLDRYDKAIEMYERYLATTPATDEKRSTVEGLLAQVHALAAALPAPSPSPPPVEPPAPAPVVSAPAATFSVSAAEPAPMITVAAPAHKRSLWRRTWWLVPVGATVLAGAAVGLYFGLSRSGDACGGATIGCVPLGASRP